MNEVLIIRCFEFKGEVANRETYVWKKKTRRRHATIVTITQIFLWEFQVCRMAKLSSIFLFKSINGRKLLNNCLVTIYYWL